MSWKKNAFSYVIWLVYVLLSGAVTFRQTELIKELLGGGVYIEIIAVICALAISGGMALLLYLFTGRDQDAKKDGVSVSILFETALAVLLLVVGLLLRIRLLPEAGEQVMYFETAKVADGREIPRIVHGAGFVYIMLLRVLFIFLGNKMIVGIWAQIVMQLLTAIFLFFAVKKFSGSLAALILLLFVTCSDAAVREAVILSPRILFLLLFTLGISLLCVCKTKKLYPCLFLLCGILAGIIVWLDAGGILLILIGTAIVFSEWEQRPVGIRRVASVILLFSGGAVSFCSVISVDAVYSQSTFANVLSAWLQLYRPKTLNTCLSVGESISPWGILLVVLLLFNIFSFWWDRYHERMSVWAVTAGVAAAAECAGLLTEELPAGMYLFVSLAVLAGVGVQDCIRRVPEKAEPNAGPKESMNEPYPEEERPEKVEELKESKKEPCSEKKPGSEESSEQSTELKMPQEPAGIGEAEKTGKEKKTRFIENPLPLPRLHKRKVLDFDRSPGIEEWDFDYPVDENDDFDIK